MAIVSNAVKYCQNFNRRSRAYERYRQTDDRQTTDGRTTKYSERSRSLKKWKTKIKRYEQHC